MKPKVDLKREIRVSTQHQIVLTETVGMLETKQSSPPVRAENSIYSVGSLISAYTALICCNINFIRCWKVLKEFSPYYLYFHDT